MGGDAVFGNSAKLTSQTPPWRAHSCVPRRVSELLISWQRASTRARAPRLVFALAWASLNAQSPPEPALPAPDTVIRIDVNLVQIDAIVTDRRGRPVTDLKTDDFRILQDGKPQTICNFSYISTSAAVGSGAAALKPSQVRRTVAFVVDDLGLSSESVARVQNALRKFVGQQMQTGDLVAIIRTGAGVGALQQFTSDKRLLYAAIDLVKFNPMGRAGIGSFASVAADGRKAGTAADVRFSGIFSTGTLGAVGYVVEGLRELPGRKSVILFSENLDLLDRYGPIKGALDSMRHLIDNTNRASAVIYAIDPSGTQTAAPTSGNGNAVSYPRRMRQINSIPGADQETDSRGGLTTLAHDTGGLFLDSDIDRALRTAIEDSDGYYLIGYRPDASTFDPKTGEFRYHNMKVEVTRPGLTVRTRQGFYGRPESERRPIAPRTRQEELLHALSSPFGASDIHVRLTPFFTVMPQSVSIMSGVLYIDPKDLTFAIESGGVHKASIDVMAVTFGDNGQAINTSNRTYPIAMEEADYRDTLKTGLFYHFRHPVKQPGAYQVRVAVRDATSGKLGSANQFLSVPDIRKGRLTLSTLVIESLPLPAFAEPVKGPDAGGGEEGQIREVDAQGSPGVRIFKPGAEISYGYQVLNARLGVAKQAELEAWTRLYREGKVVYAGKPMRLSAAGQPDVRQLVEGGTMKLADGLAPGDYVLQVVVDDKLAKGPYSTASQWIDFEVR